MVNGTDKPILGFGRMIYQMTPEAVEAQTHGGLSRSCRGWSRPCAR